MSIAIEENSTAETRKKQLRKTFNHLKTHASAVSNFTLQWQDLEDHFLSIQNSIQFKLQKLKTHQNPLTLNAQSNSKEINSEPTVEPKSQSSEIQLDSQTNVKLDGLPQSVSDHTQLNILKALAGTEESLPENMSFNEIPVRDGKALLELAFSSEHLRERNSSREDILNALKTSSNSGKLVIEAVSGFYPSESKTEGTDSEVNDMRKKCLLLLEEFMKLKLVFAPEVREEANKFALEWKGKLQPHNPFEVWGFLLLLGTYGLVGEFDKDEILKLFYSVVLRKPAPEVLMSLGYADQASDIIEKLISDKNQLDAVRFIYAFELVEKFPPVPLLKAHLRQSKKVGIVGKNKGHRKLKVDYPTNKEVNALRNVIRCIEVYNLGSQYSPDSLKKRMECLLNQKEKKTTDKEETTRTLGSQSQVQRASGKKRAASDSKNQPNNQYRNKNPRTALAATAMHYSLGTADAIHHPMHHRSLYRPPVMYERQEGRYLIPSVEIAAPAPAEYGAASKIYSVETSHYQPAGSYTSQGAPYSAGHYNLVRSVPDTHRNLSPGSYGSGGSHTQHFNLTSAAYGLVCSPVAQHESLTTGAYGLTGSTPVNHQISPPASHYEVVGSCSVNPHINSLIERYEPSIDASGRQYGSSGLPSSMDITSNASASLPYYPTDYPRVPSYNDRPASSSGHDVLPNRYQSIYRI